MRRKLLIAALIVGAMALVGAGTWAATTVNGSATSVITTGGVEIAVKEYIDTNFAVPGASPVLVTYPAEPVAVMPTREVSKVVKIENIGESEAWVRVRFVRHINGMANGTTADPSLIDLKVNGNGMWSFSEGWWYYTEKLSKGAKTDESLQSVEFMPGMGNEYQNSTVTVSVEAQAVQTAHNGDSYDKAAGWPDTAD